MPCLLNYKVNSAVFFGIFFVRCWIKRSWIFWSDPYFYIVFLKLMVSKEILEFFFENVTIVEPKNLDWKCQKTWRRASKNTLWCLLGCTIGDMGTILFFQITEIAIHPLSLLFWQWLMEYFFHWPWNIDSFKANEVCKFF